MKLFKSLSDEDRQGIKDTLIVFGPVVFGFIGFALAIAIGWNKILAWLMKVV